ncbi:unnamed protein product [Parnassius mnemosyne]|uniref:Tc1-like transposase DDE domain-containing protein n=1 Tax=Parnassius mnemosyne TaxID=213953 RepID=A0AAV1M7H5_9NEOP
MVATFVFKTGHVTTIPLEGQRTDNTEWYASICLPQVVSELRKENCNRRIILHHDNASSHTAHRTKEFLEQENIELLDHPPYSPDLSPNDFYTLPKIKNKLRGQRFSSPEEAYQLLESTESVIYSWGDIYAFTTRSQKIYKIPPPPPPEIETERVPALSWRGLVAVAWSPMV